MSTGGSILILEDDAAIVDLLEIHLADNGYRTTVSKNGIEGLERARSESFDLIILDIMLPGLDGLSICRQIREENIRTPILMLTAKSDEIDRVLGLEIGADDYITKPFSIRELVARVRAMLRRMENLTIDRGTPPSREVRRVGPLQIDVTRRVVHSRGTAVELTPKEFDLLAVLSEQPGKAFNRQELLELVWGYQYDGYSHTVNSHINRLRSKIEDDPTNPVVIETVWGFGYRLAGGEEERDP